MADTAAQVSEKLARQEATTGRSGAIPRMPKQMMLDASEAKEKNPNMHLRWVTLRDPNKVASRKLDGYVEIAAKDGGKRIGDEMVLMGLPKDQYEQRRAQLDLESRRRLVQHQKQWEDEAEGMAKMLRDKHGITVTAEQLMRV